MRLCRGLSLVALGFFVWGCATVTPPSGSPAQGLGPETATYRTPADAPRILDAIDLRLAAKNQTAADLSTPDLRTYSSLLLAAGRLAEADQAFLVLAGREPTDRDLGWTLALIAGARGDTKLQAARVAAFDKAFPGDPESAALRARLLAAQGDRVGARAAWTAVVAQSEDPTALIALGTQALDAKRPKEALGFADRAVKAAPDDDQAWAFRARVLGALARYLEARQDLDRAVELAPQDPWHRLDRGKLIWLHLYEPEAARADLEFAVAKDPTPFFTWEALAEVYEELERPRQAYDAWMKALSIRPDYRFGYPSAAMLAFRYRDFARAAAYAKEAAKDHPAEFAFPFVEALSLRALGKPAPAQVALDKARPRFTRGSAVDEMFRFLSTPGSDYYLNTALNLEKQESVRLRLRFYQGCAYVLAKATGSAKAALEEVGGSTLKKIPEIAAARDWLDHGL